MISERQNGDGREKMKTRIQNTAAFAPSASSGLRQAKEDRGQQGRSAILFSMGLACIFFWLGAVNATAQSLEFDGLIEPRMAVKVGSGVYGIIDTVTVDRGDTVKAGQVIATLQSGVERATMELARTRAEMKATIKGKKEELEYAKRKQERLRDLYEKKALPFNDWDDAETKRILAELQLAEALENKKVAEMEFKRSTEVVNRTVIKSPITGVVVERFLSPGEYIENQAILKVAQIDPLYVEVIMPVKMLGSVKVGMKGLVKPEAPVGGIYTAGVIVVDRVVDAASGTFGVRLELPNPEYHLPPGLKCKVVFLSP
jgi:RND family efflux transporter MFP subunit